MKNFTLPITIALFLLLSLRLIGQNHPPVAVTDTLYCSAGMDYTIYPLVNDYDIDGDAFDIKGVSCLNNGSIIVNYSDSSIYIVSKWNSSATDTLRYIIRDVNGGFSFGNVLLHINSSNIIDSLDVNNVSALFAPFGNFFWDFYGAETYKVPANSSTGTIFTSVPWIGGLDVNDSLHLAGETYKTKGSDFFAGPIRDTSIQTREQDSIWNRIWKISKDEISFHRNNYYMSGYVPIEAIANWPANGNVSLGQAQNLAPFVDVNNDGIYNPMNGDYPNIKGDQSVYIIFNDSRSKHRETRGLPLGVEIHEMAYAYKCPTDEALRNTIFLHYDVINRSNNNYHDTYFGLFTDFDIGYSNDDYIGCDTLRNSYFGYNGVIMDGLGRPFDYGAYPPAQAVTSLTKKMDHFLAYEGQFNPYSTPPEDALDFYLNLQAIWNDSTHITSGGNGHISGGANTNYIYSGDDTSALGGWTELSVNNSPFDRRGLGSFGPFAFNANSTFSYDFALIYARDSTLNDRSVSKLKNNIDLIQSYFNNDSTPCGGNFSSINDKIQRYKSVKVYPNPAENNLLIEYKPINSNATYKFISLSSQVIKSGVLDNNEIHSIDLSQISSGFYFLIVNDGDFNSVNKVIVK